VTVPWRNGAGDKEAGPEYDLYAVINHTGTMAGGHYVATCRAPGAPPLDCGTPCPCAAAALLLVLSKTGRLRKGQHVAQGMVRCHLVHHHAAPRPTGTKDQWYTFNDEVVVKTQASSVATANAYILFYVRRNA
jgi:ubiquitin C-terminal hydrolase